MFGVYSFIDNNHKILNKQEDQYFAKEFGTHLIAIFYEISDDILKDTKGIYKTIINSLKEDGFHIVKKSLFKVKSPKNYPAVSIDVIFLESGLQFSTYPEYNSALLDFHSCRGENDGLKIYNDLCSYLRPKRTFEQIISIKFSSKNNSTQDLESIINNS
ncbi:MAG: S-adenosylmethionine decarboxylase [Candidatus Woesearchaeota archaeon]